MFLRPGWLSQNTAQFTAPPERLGSQRIWGSNPSLRRRRPACSPLRTPAVSPWPSITSHLHSTMNEPCTWIECICWEFIVLYVPYVHSAMSYGEIKGICWNRMFIIFRMFGPWVLWIISARSWPKNVMSLLRKLRILTHGDSQLKQYKPIKSEPQTLLIRY